MPTYEQLRLKTGMPITEEWFDKLVDALTALRERGAVTYNGYILRSLIPAIDLALNLGINIYRLLQVHALYAYLSYVVFAYQYYPQPVQRWVLLSNYEGLIAFDLFTGKRYRVQMVEVY